MEIFIIGLLVLNLVAVLFMATRKKPKQDDSALGLLKQDITSLADKMTELREGIGKELNQSSSDMQKSLQAQLQSSGKIVAEVTQRLTKLDETNKRVVDVADELKMLQTVLTNPKQRGVLGEYYLQTVLENVLPPNGYQMQYKFSDGEIVDSVVFADRKKIIPIDSKFSLENYNRLVGAKDPVEKTKYAALLKSDLKKRIDETAKYIRPDEDTLDFAFMFIPSEAIFYDLLVSNVGASSRDLIEYAFQEKKVIIASPTTLLAYLQTVMQGLRSLQIEEQAKDIQKRVGQLGSHIGRFEDLMQKLGKSLGTTVNHYNASHKELKKIDKDVVKIAETSPAVEALILDKPQEE